MHILYQKLLLLIASATNNQCAAHMSYLIAENQIYRRQLPGRIPLTPQDRNRLARFGAQLGGTLDQFCTIVHPGTLRRWIRERKSPAALVPTAPRGRPRTDDEIRALIVQIAEATRWGYSRILGELKKLGIEFVSRNTIKNILKEQGLDPGPDRGGTWRAFIHQHASTLWQCDFFSAKVVTPTGFRDMFVLAFLHIATRRVFLTPATSNPDGAWIERQAAAFLDHARSSGLPADHLVHDRDSKFSPEFDAALRASGTTVHRTAYRSPNMNAFVERFVGTIKSECLDHFVIFGETHMNFLCAEFLDHYYIERPHQGLENALLLTSDPPLSTDASDPLTLSLDSIRCAPRLGGLLKHYHRAAA